MKNKFNYIITIHNKENILKKTLDGVDKCSSNNSFIYTVLDGCTDRSEQIIDKFIAKTNKKVIKIKTNDVHEIKSINAALCVIKEGFIICLQDDVILQEPNLEKKVEMLYKKEGEKLGVISFCRAANLRKKPFFKQIKLSKFKSLVELCNQVKAKHDQCNIEKTCDYNRLVYRMIAIKSPVCISEKVFKKIGILDETLAPYSWDDHEYCIRAMKAGFINGLFPLKFISKLEWGGTRQDPDFVKEAAKIHIRNRRYIWEKHGDFITRFWKSGNDYILRFLLK